MSYSVLVFMQRTIINVIQYNNGASLSTLSPSPSQLGSELAWQTVIKYQEGYVQIPTVGIVPKPYQLWTHPQRSWLTAIYIAFSIAWALEIVSHLEELCFWLFLINVGAAQNSWFRSINFK